MKDLERTHNIGKQKVEMTDNCFPKDLQDLSLVAKWVFSLI